MGSVKKEQEPMSGTVVMRWEKGYAEKLVVVTDLDEKETSAAWYQMRFWIEDEYKDHKSGGWGWEQTKMTDPKRAERQWLARAVAMQIAVLVGGQEEAEGLKQKCSKTRKLKGKRRVGRPLGPICRPRAREQSVLMAGQQTIQATVIRGEEIPQGHVVAEEWPKQTYGVAKPTKSWVKKCKEKEAKKRSHKNKQSRTCQAEKQEAGTAVPKSKKKEHQAKEPKHVQKRERTKQEQEATHLLRQAQREERKREQEEHRVQKHREREERKREQEAKRERRLQAQEEREQERLRRRVWHEEIKCERERRVARKQERMASLASEASATSSALSMIVADYDALGTLTKPP
jgi:hypothetical protein